MFDFISRFSRPVSMVECAERIPFYYDDRVTEVGNNPEQSRGLSPPLLALHRHSERFEFPLFGIPLFFLGDFLNAVNSLKLSIC